MTIIAPSLLSANFLELRSEIEILNSINNLWFHLDIMDGHFVPNLTFGHPLLHQIKKMAKHPLDAHLMVTNPDFYVDSFKKFNLHNVTVHYETSPHLDRLIHSVKDNYPSVGISLNPATNVEVLPDYLLKEIDLILIMSVNPGFGGQKFIPGVLSKIKKLHQKRKELAANFQIQVDGGVDAQWASELIKQGVDNLVAGSFIFKAPPQEYSQQIALLLK